MKKLLFVILLFGFSFSAYSQEPEQISKSLKYETSADRSGFNFRITDMYDDQQKNIRFHIRKNTGTVFDIYYQNSYGNNYRIGAANLYSDEFHTVITGYINEWRRQNNGNDEWRQYASTIAEKITLHLKSQYSDLNPNPSPSPSPNPNLSPSPNTNPSPSRNPSPNPRTNPPPQQPLSYLGEMYRHGSQTFYIWLVIGRITASGEVADSYCQYYDDENRRWRSQIVLTGYLVNGTLTLFEREPGTNNRRNRAVMIFPNFNTGNNNLAGVWQDLLWQDSRGDFLNRYEIKAAKK
jgi:hypothetical protein